MPLVLRIFLTVSLILVTLASIATGILVWVGRQAVLESLPADRAQFWIERQTWFILLVVGALVVAQLAISSLIIRHFARMIWIVTKTARSVEAGNYDAPDLAAIAGRNDDLGALARVFQSMMEQVRDREQHLKQQVQALRVEIDEVKRAHAVSAITESESFQDLQRRAAELRARHAHDQPAPGA